MLPFGSSHLVPQGQSSGGGTKQRQMFAASGIQRPTLPASSVQRALHGQSSGGAQAQGDVAELSVRRQIPSVPSSRRHVASQGQATSQTPSAPQVASATRTHSDGHSVVALSMHSFGHWQQTAVGQVQSAAHALPSGQMLVVLLPVSHASPGSISPSPQISLFVGAHRSVSRSRRMRRVPN
jgi:hypothetical protein